MICTGRSDYPNQVNNVLCFPYIFRGALDVGATTINEEMKHAAVRAIAALARETPSEVVARAYGGRGAALRPQVADPEPLRSAPDSAHRAGGRARRDGERRRDAGRSRISRPTRIALTRFVFRSGFIMKPLFAQARAAPQPRHLRGGRGRARAARDAGGARGGAREADPDRPPERGGSAHQALRPLDRGRARFRNHQPGGRSALPRLCRNLCRGRRPQGHHAGRGARPGAHQHDRDRRAGGAARRRGRADLRPRRALPVAPASISRDIIGLAPAPARSRLCRSSSRRRAPISLPTRMCSPIRAPRRSPRWRSRAPSMCAASASSRRSR